MPDKYFNWTEMKIHLVAAFSLICTIYADAQTYTNPVIHSDYSDPDVCRTGNDFYMTSSSFNCFPGLQILHSTDLVHWNLIGAALTGYPGRNWDEDAVWTGLKPGEKPLPVPDANSWSTTVQHGNGVWAPSIRYHNGEYYIYCGDPDRGIFMVKTKDPAGTWEEPVWVIKAKGFIDPCPLWDEDGKAYLSYGCAGSRAGNKSILFVAPLSPDGCRTTGPGRIVFDGHRSQPTIEGTKFYKRNGYYYIFSPAGGVATGWQTVLRATNPFGPYEDRIVMNQSGAAGKSDARKHTHDIPQTNGPHQGAWIDTEEGEDWFIHFQDKGAYGRIVHLQPMRWVDDWPIIGEDPEGDGTGRPVDRWKAPATGTGIAAAANAGPLGIGLEWQYPAVPSPYWHFAMQGGDIRLFSVQQAEDWRNLSDTPNMLMQKFSAESFEITAKLTFMPNPELKGKGETAGMAVMGLDYAGLQITDTDRGPVLQYIECENALKGQKQTVSEISILKWEYTSIDHSHESVTVPAVKYIDMAYTSIWVRLDVSPRHYERDSPDPVCTFSYSTDGKKFTKAGTSIAMPGKWIGAKWGFFCNRYAPKNDSGHLDITDLKIVARQ